MWIPLIDASVENGCLYVLPRAHNCDLLRHTPNEAGTYLAIGTNDLPPVEPVPIPVRKGGVLLMTNRTPHASFENTTDRVRWSMDLRYQSATLPTNADITAPTSDEAAAVPAACYPPAKDFLVRSRKHPDDMVSDAQVFHDLRARHRAEYDAGFAKSAPGSEKRRINPFSLERWQ
jgi:ectoine hydroxylase-related dioxygenase (phytanoyl-CoA dioxygenase family)